MGVRLSVDSSNHATPSKRQSHIHTNGYDVGSKERDEPPEIFDCDVSGPGSYDFISQTKVGHVHYLSAAHLFMVCVCRTASTRENSGQEDLIKQAH